MANSIKLLWETEFHSDDPPNFIWGVMHVEIVSGCEFNGHEYENAVVATVFDNSSYEVFYGTKDECLKLIGLFNDGEIDTLMVYRLGTPVGSKPDVLTMELVKVAKDALFAKYIQSRDDYELYGTKLVDDVSDDYLKELEKSYRDVDSKLGELL